MKAIKQGSFKKALVMIDILEIAADIEGGAIQDRNKVTRLKKAIEDRLEKSE